MIIGIDIDDTIANSYPVFIKYAKKYNKDKKIKHKIDTSKWDQEEAFGWDKDNQKEFRKLYLKKIYSEVKPKKKVAKYIKKLNKEGNKIIIITARTNKEANNIYSLTESWLNKYHIYFDKLVVESYNKKNDCQKNEINLFIDDNYENCLKISQELKIPVFLFSNRYNKNYDLLDIEKVNNWLEIYLKINEGEKK